MGQAKTYSQISIGCKEHLIFGVQNQLFVKTIIANVVLRHEKIVGLNIELVG